MRLWGCEGHALLDVVGMTRVTRLTSWRQDGDVVEAALDLFRSRPVLGFSDCLMLELARRAGHLPLGTFDRNLGRTEGAQRLLSSHAS